MPALPTGWSSFSAREMGFPGPEPVAGSLPPGDGAWTTPNFLSFQSLIQSASRAYRWTFDEALLNSQPNALAMRRDAVLMGALRARQRPTAQLSWHITPQDETDPAEAEAAKLITGIMERIPKFQKMKMSLLESLWFGRYAVELIYRWDKYKGRTVLTVADYIPVNGDKLRFKWDGTPGVLVYPGFPGTKESTDWGMAHFLTRQERQAYIIHEHEPDDADWTEPQLGGAIHGVGIRGRLYWYWWLKQQVFTLMLNYLERFSSGLTIFYYNASDPAAKAEAAAAAKAQFASNAILYPRWNTEKPDTNKVERLEVSTASPALMQNLVTEYFDNIMVRYILGQTLSSDAAATGLGSGVADLHGDTLAEIIKYDAVDLAETLQSDLIATLYRYNCKGIPVGKFEFEIDSPNAQELMGYGQQLFEWGVPLDEDQAYKISQWAKPKPGAGIITKLGAMQPAAAGGMPQATPVIGGVGPQDVPPEEMAGQGPPPGMVPGQGPMPYRRGPNGKLIRRFHTANGKVPAV